MLADALELAALRRADPSTESYRALIAWAVNRHPLSGNPHARGEWLTQHAASIVSDSFSPRWTKTTTTEQKARDISACMHAVDLSFAELDARATRARAAISDFAWRKADADAEDARAIAWRHCPSAPLVLQISIGADEDLDAPVAQIDPDCKPWLRWLRECKQRYNREPSITPSTTDQSLERWERRQIRRLTRQSREVIALLQQRIGARSSEQYASSYTIKDRAQQLAKQQEWIDSCVLLSDGGDEISMRDVVRDTHARFSELFVLTRGLEQWAADSGFEPYFVTGTLPGNWHPNPEFGPTRWNGKTPKDAHEELGKKWLRFLRRLHAKNIDIRGLRVAEPHQDACPHWHAVIFAKPDDAPIVKQYFEHYFGAAPQSNWQDSNGDAKASSYMMKYISKAVAREDDKTLNLDTPTDAIDAWRATWGIRSYQFFGLPRSAITLWRESRRVSIFGDDPDPIRQLALLSQRNDAAGFLRVLSLRDAETLKTCQRDENGLRVSRWKIVGFRLDHNIAITRQKRWIVTSEKVIHSLPRGGERGAVQQHEHRSPPALSPPDRSIEMYLAAQRALYA